MRSVAIRRFVLALAALFVIVAAGFGWLANRPDGGIPPIAVQPTGDARTGAQAFDTYCASCHTRDAIRAIVERRTDRQRARTELERFLSTHGDAPEEQQRAIVEYIAGGS
jgi:mono/diheme cytochrome c family protein